MLETLTIKNIAVIDSAEIPFKQGLNILSGETGAGKSVVIEAISLVLGSRASVELIRAGCEEAVIEGLFDISELPWMRDRLQRMGFPNESSELLIKRVVHRGGKHRIYVNGELATLSILQDLCDGLVDLCGQHEHQSLLKAGTQLELIDRYGGLLEQAKSYSGAYSHFRSLGREQEVLASAEAERSRRADFLKFQIDELSAAKLVPGEVERLGGEKQLLQSGEQRATLANAVVSILEDESAGVFTSIRSALSKLKSLNALDARVQGEREGLERALAEAEEASISLNRYLGQVELDPERLGEIQERLSLIAELRRKYGPTVQDMLAALSRLEGEMSELGHVGERLQDVTLELEKARAELRKQGLKLSQTRKKVAILLSKSVTEELKDLKMSEAKFMIELNPKEEIEAWAASGADSVQYLVQTNRGEPARPLSKIASGGELSRLMLAIRRVIADRGGIGVYLFDEIDAGIGGQTAFQVGKKLKSVASYNQVICITHLPQVASFADHHLSVRKSTHGNRTLTEIIELSAAARKQELARMLGGPQLTKKSLENAAELIQMAR